MKIKEFQKLMEASILSGYEMKEAMSSLASDGWGVVDDEPKDPIDQLLDKIENK